MVVKIKFVFPSGEMTTKAEFRSFEHLAQYLCSEKLSQEHNGIWATDIKIEILAYKGEK